MNSEKEIKNLKLAYLHTFESEEGKKVLADLKRRCYYGTTTFTDNPALMAFNEGTRSIVLHILTMMNMDNINKKEEE